MPDSDHTELLRPIPGFSLYRMDANGVIESCMSRGHRRRTDKWRRLRPTLMWNGYYGAMLVADDGNKYRRYIHQLVLLTFVGPRPSGMEIRHLDGVSTNNHVSNLVYGTPQENQQDRARHGTGNEGSKHGLSKLIEAEVIQIRSLVADGGKPSQVAAKFNVSPRAVRDIVARKRWAHLP